jgi:hypothetical protein
MVAKPKRILKARNPLHDHPLMRKGGVHARDNKANRKVEKQRLKQEWRCFMTLVQCH